MKKDWKTPKVVELTIAETNCIDYDWDNYCKPSCFDDSSGASTDTTGNSGNWWSNWWNNWGWSWGWGKK